MSMADDFDIRYDPYIFEDDSEDVCVLYLLGKAEWTTKEGKQINVLDMTPMHIRSCMRLFPNYKYWHIVWNYELKRRGL